MNVYAVIPLSINNMWPKELQFNNKYHISILLREQGIIVHNINSWTVDTETKVEMVFDSQEDRLAFKLRYGL